MPSFVHMSVLLGESHLDDFVNGRSRKGEKVALDNVVDSFDVSSICNKFPSITIGSSPRVELYKESFPHSEIFTYSASQSSEEFQPTLTDGNWMVPETLTDIQSPIPPRLQNLSSSVIRDGASLPSMFEHDQTNNPDAHESGPSALEEPSSPVVLEHDKLVELILDKPIRCIEGLSKRHSRQLEDCGIHTLRKLLHHFPRTYADLHNSHFGIEDGQYFIFVGKVLSSRAVKATFSLSVLEVIVCGEAVDHNSKAEVDPDDLNSRGKRTIYLHLKKFLRGSRFTSQGFLHIIANKHKEGDIVCASGKRTTSKKDHYEMREYSVDIIKNEGDSSLPAKGMPYPVYPSKGGLKPQFFKDIIGRVLQSLSANIDPIPREITRDIGLLQLKDAYIAIHQPEDLNVAHLARRRFIFDEFFYLQLGRLYQMLEGLASRIEKEGLLDKYRNIDQNATFAEDWCDLTRSFLKGLPYSLTKSQLSSVSEIIWDLKRPVPMNRLLQGDVGCGKTVVAFLACMEVIGSGYQAAYMVPTELLAIQHYNDILSLLENVESDKRPSVALLTGSTPTKQARMIRNDLQSGTISLVIGTHSLTAESVIFSALRLAVIDEQHRFGVIQRGKFNSKLWYASAIPGINEVSSVVTPKAEVQMAPHVLAMSATPIPRSLALALYGDMSLTQITDLPPGRLPIETKIVEGSEEGFENVYEMMLRELEAGGKVYIVYPIIAQSEQLPQLRAASGDFLNMCSKFPTYKCGLLHGRMKGDDKDKALKDFRAGETQILLATQVIEIGVDVPDASMMVVMNAERFGIAQLHQLRGRVGRGSKKSKCVYVASTTASVDRLRVLEHSSDGFHLAKVDLLLRGPGDLLGKRQSGHLPEFPIARLEIDGTIIQDAHLAALKTLSASYDLVKYPELKAELSMRQPLSLLGD
ncbi:ATP-dependent DNA helicase homolog RECG1, chloroplastic/mitochondrial isoform X2 [Silene latifolia]|uniref:ATP-dependent DNA helicase homolog RECG1, chloroplastic/mitochondrial isoform X2 n=1 Tax=Silene latifolia TaxID=37657 RepID=UPI003D78A9C3